MKYLLVFLLLCCSMASYAGRHKDRRGLPRTEVALMNNVLACLSNKDTVSYFNLFVPFDTLWRMVMHNANHSPEATVQLANLKEHPQALLEFDPNYNRGIMQRFTDILKKGEDSGIHWDQILLQRYELSREVITSRTLLGYDIIAPERFRGYVFIRDMLGRHTYCISITEIQKINGYFFGGQVFNILEAASIDQFIAREAEEKKYFELLEQKELAHADSIKRGLIDTTAAAAVTDTAAIAGASLSIEQGEEDTFKKRRDVVDRRYYEGKFDDEIPVKLFIRYMKDRRTNKINGYDGLYKFGDQAEYARLYITRSKEGVWTFEDDPPVGIMELELQGKVYTGSWTNNENGTGYDVVLTQKDLPSIPMQQLDKMLETDNVGRVDGETAQPPKAPAEPQVEGMENTPDSETAQPKQKEAKKKKKRPTRDDEEDTSKKKSNQKTVDDNDN